MNNFYFEILSNFLGSLHLLLSPSYSPCNDRHEGLVAEAELLLAASDLTKEYIIV